MRMEMKGMKLKLVAAAVALAVSGASQAAFVTGGGNGAETSLVFAAWNGTTIYIENLTETNSAGLANAWIATSSTPASASFQLNPLFASTFTSGTGLNWAVFGGTSSVGTQVINTTGLSDVTASDAGSIGGANITLDSWFASLNATPVGTANYGTVAALLPDNTNNPNYAGYLAPGYNGFVLGTTYMTGYGYMDFV